MDEIGLVLEGGGMRGVYTAGILEYFMERELFPPYVIGVSAGACNAASYIARQKGRNRRVTVDFVNHPRYLGFRNLIREKSIFGMKLIFDEIPNRIVPFDFDTFEASPQKFVVGTTNCVTGETYYIRKGGRPMLPVIQASSSLPFLAQPMEMDGRILMDGGVTDPIPVRKAIADGYQRNIIVLTRDKDYRKKPSNLGWLARSVYPKYEGLREALARRYAVYNDTLELIRTLEEEGTAFVMRPREPLPVGRMGKDSKKLNAVYEQGYRDAMEQYDRLTEWMNRENRTGGDKP